MRAILRVPYNSRYLSMREATECVSYWAQENKSIETLPGPMWQLRGPMGDLPDLTQPLKTEAMQVSQEPTM